MAAGAVEAPAQQSITEIIELARSGDNRLLISLYEKARNRPVYEAVMAEDGVTKLFDLLETTTHEDVKASAALALSTMSAYTHGLTKVLELKMQLRILAFLETGNENFQAAAVFLLHNIVRNQNALVEILKIDGLLKKIIDLFKEQENEPSDSRSSRQTFIQKTFTSIAQGLATLAQSDTDRKQMINTESAQALLLLLRTVPVNLIIWEHAQAALTNIGEALANLAKDDAGCEEIIKIGPGALDFLRLRSVPLCKPKEAGLDPVKARAKETLSKIARYLALHTSDKIESPEQLHSAKDKIQAALYLLKSIKIASVKDDAAVALVNISQSEPGCKAIIESPQGVTELWLTLAAYEESAANSIQNAAKTFANIAKTEGGRRAIMGFKGGLRILLDKSKEEGLIGESVREVLSLFKIKIKNGRLGPMVQGALKASTAETLESDSAAKTGKRWRVLLAGGGAAATEEEESMVIHWPDLPFKRVTLSDRPAEEKLFREFDQPKEINTAAEFGLAGGSG